MAQTRLPPEFSAREAKAMLSPYYKASDKLLESLADKKLIIRLKRGLYTLKENYHPITAASAIASPSYVSFETALAFYGAIPERTHAIFSVIDGRPLEHRIQDTTYFYRSQRRDLYAKGMTAIKIGDRNILFASPEKALLDTLAWKSLRTKDLTPKDVFEFTCESLRFEDSLLIKMSISKLKSMAPLYRNKAPQLLVQAIKEYRKVR